MGKIKAPELITEKHELASFDCGNHVLNEWLKKKACKNQNHFSKTRVVCLQNRVIAYYTLAFGSVSREEMQSKVKRNSPHNIPVMILARLAVDNHFKGQGIAKHLLKEAFLKTVEASTLAGLRGIIVHAINEEATLFYKHYGFSETPVDLTLFMTVEAIMENL